MYTLAHPELQTIFVFLAPTDRSESSVIRIPKNNHMVRILLGVFINAGVTFILHIKVLGPVLKLNLTLFKFIKYLRINIECFVFAAHKPTRCRWHCHGGTISRYICRNSAFVFFNVAHSFLIVWFVPWKPLPDAVRFTSNLSPVVLCWYTLVPEPPNPVRT